MKRLLSIGVTMLVLGTGVLTSQAGGWHGCGGGWHGGWGGCGWGGGVGWCGFWPSLSFGINFGCPSVGVYAGYPAYNYCYAPATYVQPASVQTAYVYHPATTVVRAPAQTVTYARTAPAQVMIAQRSTTVTQRTVTSIPKATVTPVMQRSATPVTVAAAHANGTWVPDPIPYHYAPQTVVLPANSVVASTPIVAAPNGGVPIYVVSQ